MYDDSGRPRELRSDDIARELLRIQTHGPVPLEVRRLFEVARGTALYGWFYPLYQLSVGEALRAADAALAARVSAENGPTDQKFVKRIDWLAAHLDWPQDQVDRWHTIRELRNKTSHPTDQSLHMPGTTVNLLDRIAYDISEVSRRPGDPPTPEPRFWPYHTISSD